MKRWIVLSLLLAPLLASAEGFWDGNAALQRGDASFESGLYAASNSFPPGTLITIQNQDTGKTVTATISGRIEGQSDILVLLSPKTADALGLPQGTLGRVRVTVPTRTDSTASAQAGDQTVSSDPDINPAAAYGAPDRTQVASAPPAGPAAVPGGIPATTPAAETPATSPAAETPATTPPAETPATTAAQATPSEETLPAASATAAPAETALPEAPAVAQPTTAPQSAAESTPPASTDVDNAAIISAAQSRNPQKQVFQPPREDEKFVYHPPVTVPPQAVTTTTPAATPQAAPTITAVVGEPGVTPAAQPAADLALASPEPAPEGQVAQGPVQTEVTGPAAVPPAGPGAPKLALLPPEAPAPTVQQTTQAAPPAAATTQSTVAATTTTTTTTTTKGKPPAAASVQTASSLPRSGSPGTYFLQLGAYGTEQVARDLAAKLAPTYPALVLTPSSPGSSVFKVVIGPLNRAESGTLLTWFRYRGFPDAFLKQE